MFFCCLQRLTLLGALLIEGTNIETLSSFVHLMSVGSLGPLHEIDGTSYAIVIKGIILSLGLFE
jgi:hypothetical protein